VIEDGRGVLDRLFGGLGRLAVRMGLVGERGEGGGTDLEARMDTLECRSDVEWGFSFDESCEARERFELGWEDVEEGSGEYVHALHVRGPYVRSFRCVYSRVSSIEVTKKMEGTYRSDARRTPRVVGLDAPPPLST
jgi:hypothetical protein